MFAYIILYRYFQLYLIPLMFHTYMQVQTFGILILFSTLSTFQNIQFDLSVSVPSFRVYRFHYFLPFEVNLLRLEKGYFDIDDFFVDFFDPITVIGESFHADNVVHIGFPEIIVVIAGWIIFGR